MVLLLRRFRPTGLFAKSRPGYGDFINFFPVEERQMGCFRNQHASAQMNMVELNMKLKSLVKNGELADARHMFDALPNKDEISWTTMISAYVNSSDSVEALSLFSRMRFASDTPMDPFVLSLALKACALSVDINSGEMLHCFCVKSGFFNSVFVGSAMLDMYMKNGRVFEGSRCFDDMPLRNVVSWTAIITGLVRSGLSYQALSYFSKMWLNGVEHDAYTFAIALKACADLEFLNHGKEIHARTIKKGVDATSYVVNSLSAMYNKCGKLNHGLSLFGNMAKPDVVSWTSLITTYVQAGQDQQGISSFVKMREDGISPNEYTYAIVISGISNLARLDWGHQMHGHALKVGFLKSLSVANSLMTMYFKCEQCDSARDIFNVMSTRDIISWSTLISGYCQCSYGEEAFELLARMRSEGPRPSEYALSSVISVCGSMANLDQGRQLHAYALTIGLDQTAMTQSALINMYSKCGSIAEAAKIFSASENDDIVSWTAMISGYAEHGHSHEAINLFEKISHAGLKPDSVTFIGVLSACSHAGLVDLGFHYFNSMTNQFRITPSKEHFGCMIDLLCRAGRLREAEDMIKSMPFEPDDVVWTSLLTASREKGNVEYGGKAAKHILRLVPDCAGTLITLANIYASRGKWSEAAYVRKMLKSRGVMKEPGWSWIKMKNQICSFVSGDKSHPQYAGIQHLLELIASSEEVITLEEHGFS